MNNNKDSQLNELQYKMQCAVKNAYAIQVAMDYGPFSPNEWFEALAAACSNLQELADNITELTAIKDVKA